MVSELSAPAWLAGSRCLSHRGQEHAWSKLSHLAWPEGELQEGDGASGPFYGVPLTVLFSQPPSSISSATTPETTQSPVSTQVEAQTSWSDLFSAAPPIGGWASTHEPFVGTPPIWTKQVSIQHYTHVDRWPRKLRRASGLNAWAFTLRFCRHHLQITFWNKHPAFSYFKDAHK